MKDYKRLTEICNDIIGDCKPCKPQENALKEIIKAIESGELCDGTELEQIKKDRDEYKNRAEVADIVISELRAKLSKAEHDRARYEKRISSLQAENAALRERLDRAVELPCKVGDKVYGVGFTDCEDGHTTNEKKKRQIFNVCMKMGGNCEKCKYSLPAIEEFTCTHIQLGACGIYGQSVLIVGDRNENYTENNVFTTREAAEARLAELKGGAK